MTDIFILLLVSVFIFMAVYVVYMLIRSIWRLAAGICMGFKFIQFSFIGFCIRNNVGRLSLIVGPATLTAETLLIKNDENGKDNMRLSFIETVLTIITSVISAFFLCKIYGMNNYIKSMLICLFLVILLDVYVTYNFLKEAFGTGVNHDIWEHSVIVKNRLMAGMSPADCEPMEIDPSITTVTANRCRLYNYYYYLEKKQYDELPPYIARFKHIIGEINNVAASCIPYAYEIIYYYSVIQPDLKEAEYYYELVSAWLDKDMDFNGRRVYAAYLYGTNKSVNAVKTAIRQGIESCSEDFDKMKVMRSFELGMLNELKYKVEEKHGY